MPESEGGLIVAVFGVGAYQAMLGGKGGAHHCLNPEMKRVIIEQEGDQLVTRVVEEQSLSQIITALGYRSQTLPARVRRAPTPRVRRPDVWQTTIRMGGQSSVPPSGWVVSN